MRRVFFISVAIALLGLIISKQTLIPHYLSGERIIVVDEGSRSITFVRTRSALASAEYERQLLITEGKRVLCKFELPIDGGAEGELIVAINAKEPSKFLFKDASNEFLVNVDDCNAYKVLRSRSGEYLSQVCDYKPGFPGNIDLIESSEEQKERRRLGIRTNELLDNVCHDSWQALGVLGGPTGDLQMKTINFNELPYYIKQ